MEAKDLKHGDKVTCNIKGNRVDDAKVSIAANGDIFICQNVKKGTSTYDKLGYEYSWNIYSRSRTFGGQIIPLEKQIAAENINVTNLKSVNDIDILLAKKPKKVVTYEEKLAKVTARLTEEILKTDADYHTIKPPVDLPVFSADLDSTTKDLLKRKAARI